MMVVFVLSILYKMALYMIYANLVIYALSFGRSQVSDPAYALFDGGHSLLASTLINFMPLLILSIVAVLAYLLNNLRSSLRFVPIVLLPLSFFRLIQFPLGLYLAYNIVTAIVLLMPLAYLCVKIARRDFSLKAEWMRKSIKGLTILAFAPIITSAFGGFAMLSSAFYFHYVILFIACAMGILRIARAKESMHSDPKFLMISLAPVFVTALLILTSLQIASVIWRTVQFIGGSIIVPLVLFIARGIEWFFGLFYTHEPDSVPVPDDYDYILREVTIQDETPIVVGDIYIYILAGILTTTLAFVVYRVLKAIYRRKQTSTNKGISEVRSHITSLQGKSAEKSAEHKHSLFTPRDPRMAVRYHYRQFLKLCAEKGSPPEQGDTSEEICTKNKTNFPIESMSKLRELYIKARYSKHDIKKSESKEAGKLLKKGFEFD